MMESEYIQSLPIDKQLMIRCADIGVFYTDIPVGHWRKLLRGSTVPVVIHRKDVHRLEIVPPGATTRQLSEELSKNNPPI